MKAEVQRRIKIKGEVQRRIKMKREFHFEELR